MRRKLPGPAVAGSVTLEEAIRQRRTTRRYSGSPLSLGELSQLLWAAQGVTGTSGERAVPSAGAQYPLHVYVIAGEVSDLATGLYSYHVEGHALDFVSGDDLRSRLGDAAVGDQSWVHDAAAVIVTSADVRRMRDHFETQLPRGERGVRYAYMETGALAQNVHLQGTALGLGVVLVGGFYDEKVRAALGIPAEFEPTALICIGRR